MSRGWSAGHMSQCYLQGLLQEGGVGLQGHSQVQALVPCDLEGRNRARTAEAWPPSPHHPTALHRMENGSQGQAPGNRTLLLPEVKQAPEGPGTLPAVELRAGPAAGRRRVSHGPPDPSRLPMREGQGHTTMAATPFGPVPLSSHGAQAPHLHSPTPTPQSRQRHGPSPDEGPCRLPMPLEGSPDTLLQRGCPSVI